MAGQHVREGEMVDEVGSEVGSEVQTPTSMCSLRNGGGRNRDLDGGLGIWGENSLAF